MKERLSNLGDLKHVLNILHKLNSMGDCLIIASCFWIGAMLTITQWFFVTEPFQGIALFVVFVIFLVLSYICTYLAYQTKKELDLIGSTQKAVRKK